MYNQPTFREKQNVFTPSNMKAEVVLYSETSVNFYITKRQNILEDNISAYVLLWVLQILRKELRVISPRANYTDWATAACRQS
jgi:hypothetical protein